MSKAPTFKWYEAYPPRDLTLSDVTDLVRTLASRPRQGLLQVTPIVVFELRIIPGAVRWLFGHDIELGGLPYTLTAQLPGLTLTPLGSGEARRIRPSVTMARDIRFGHVAEPLRLDTATGVAAGLYQLADRLNADESVTCQWVVGPHEAPGKTPPSGLTPLQSLGILEPRKLDSADRQAWKIKLAEPLYGVRGRLGAVGHDQKRCASLLHGALAALRLMETPRVHLRASRPSSQTARQLDQVAGKYRSWSSMVNAGELAALLGWPLADVTRPGVGIQAGPPPSTLLTDDARDERILGSAVHPAASGKLVRLPTSSSLHHVHVIAPTGSGKSTTLARWILTDATAGRSVFVIEPRGDLITDVLARIPKHLHEKVVVIDSGIKGPVVGLNPLGGPIEDAERRADQLLNLFKELFGSAIGPRSGDVLYHSLLTASRLPDGTVVDAVVLLTNSAFRRKALAAVNDPLVLAPFWADFDAKSEAEQGQIIGPVLNKLRTLTARAPIRRLLGQATPLFSLDELFQGGQRLVFVNLNRGVLGAETARLLGSLLLTEAWAAIERRATLPPEKRYPVMCVVDEFQSFVAGLDFAEVLSQSRGLGASWTVAHQDLSQLSNTLTAAVLANARTRLAFRPAHGDSAKLAGVLGDGVQPDDLERLAAFHGVARVLVDGTPSNPFEVTTSELPPRITDPTAVVLSAVDRYGVDPLELDRITAERWQGSPTTPTGPVGLRRRPRA